MLEAISLPPSLRAFPDEHRDVMLALALGGTARPRSWVCALLAELGARDQDGRPYGNERVLACVQALDDAGALLEHPQRPGHWRLKPALDSAVLGWAIDRPDRQALASALERAERLHGPGGRSPALFTNADAAIAVLRLSVFAGEPPNVVVRWHAACSWQVAWNDVLDAALASAGDGAMLRRLHPRLRAHALEVRLTGLLERWEADPVPSVEVALELLSDPAAGDELPLRTLLSEVLLCCDRLDEAGALVRPLLPAWATSPAPAADTGSPAGPDGAAAESAQRRHGRGMAMAAEAARLSMTGRWVEAEAAYDAAFVQLKQSTGRRKNLLSLPLLWPCLQALLAQRSRASEDKALKLCLAEAGQRKPTPDSPWGIAALALQMRKGDALRDPAIFGPHAPAGFILQLDLWAWQMRAWAAANGFPAPPTAQERAQAGTLAERLQAAGLARLAQDLGAALAVLDGRPAPHFFVPPALEAWQATLSALAGIAAPAVSSGTAAPDGATASRLVWVLTLDDDGGVSSLTPHEQKRNTRGWGRPAPISLWKLARMPSLAPHDAQVSRALKQPAYGSTRDVRLDLSVALSALVGHPAVEFHDAPGIAVALVESAPELEVVDDGDRLRLAVRPALRPVATLPRHADAGDLKAAEALAGLSVRRDGPDRARLVRFNAAQRRAAQLLGDGLAVPKSAAAQLQAVLQGLAAHFQIQADHLPGTRDVVAPTTLRAEMTPHGAGLRLRLVVAPFGPAGPRLAPGLGRPRLIATVQGEALATRRDLDAEREGLEAVLEACPMLGAVPPDAAAVFELEGAEASLALVEALAAHPSVESLDWPAGRPLTVAAVGIGQLQLRVRSERDWLSLAGGLRVDDALVLGIEQLLQWQAGDRGRFVPLGEGRYLALTQELRARIADLAAVAELQKDGTRVPALAAGWLESALEGSDWHSDGALRQRVHQLVAARTLQPGLPSTLQAELRPYQSDGFVWAMRLAAAGCGACLADDMGLGKTLQALAVLLARGADGPALVVAPTSLTGNWLAEAGRFAPSLNVRVWGEGGQAAGPSGGRPADRQSLIEGAGPHDVVLLSYALLQLNAEAFAARAWHTLVLDEAQALKNAASKRTRAAQALKADFRLALSGTPVENRLSELWSIMRVCNPGLLGTLPRFNDRFGTPIERDGDRDAQRLLRRLIAPFVLRRTKAQVLDDLPPRTELALTVQPDEAERAHYEVLRRQALAAAEASLAEGSAQAQIGVLAQLMRLRRAACDPRLVSPSLGLSGAKVAAFSELASELAANGHKALVFSQFVDFLALLREPLDAAGIGYQYLDGSTPAAERTRRVAAFQRGEGTLFLISLKAGGFGLNLTAADYVVIADPWWNPAAEDQASGRAHRIGQQRPVTVYRLISAGTIEERIVELHQHKRELADGVLDQDGSAHAPLDAESLVGLIRG